jgi:predicted nucleic acid-binding protein
MVNAMVLQAALRNEANRIYTSDSDLLAYNGPIEVISI